MTPTIRKARDEDFQTFYDLQNGPFRFEVYGVPPEPFDQFASKTQQQILAGLEHYFAMVEKESVTGFIWFQKSQDLWFALLWGRWLRTLVYAGCVTAFRFMQFPRLHFWIRQKNRRMIRIAEDAGYGFQKMGEDTGYALRDEFPPLVVIRSNCYEIRSEVFYENETYYRTQSKELHFDL